MLKKALHEQDQSFFQSYEELLEQGKATVNADAAGAYYENQNEPPSGAFSGMQIW